MTLPTIRRLSLTLIAALLLALLARYFLSAEESAPPVPPEYVVERTGVRAASCEQAATRVVQPAALTAQPQPDYVSQEQAAAAADALLRQHTGLGAAQRPAFEAGPALIRAILPDQDVHTVYYRLWISHPEGALSYSGNAVVVYVDAQTGQPVALYDGVTVVDPLSATDCLRPDPPGLLEVARMSFHRMRIGLLGLLVLAIIGVAWAAVKLRLHDSDTSNS